MSEVARYFGEAYEFGGLSMTEARQVNVELLHRIDAVTNKRARFVLDSIARNGLVTTEEINRAGYEHPPRAVRDARELGFRIKTIKVKHTSGRSIAAYVFLDDGTVDAKKSGRLSLPKKLRNALIAAASDRCQVCGANQNLQVDHRVPYQVAGESESELPDPFLVLCGSCNRKKSWACEHCTNWLWEKAADVCRTCYWASPIRYEHVATEPQRRADLIWVGEQVHDYEKIVKKSEASGRSVPDEIKDVLRKS